MAVVIRKPYSGDGTRKGSHFKPYLVRWTNASGRQCERSFRTNQEAKDHAAMENAKRANPYADPDRGKVLFSTWSADWLAEHQGTAKSKANYEGALRLHVNPVLGDMFLRDITSEHIRKLILRDLKVGTGKNAHKASRSMQGTCLQVIGAALEAAVQAKRIDVNPARSVKLGKVKRAALGDGFYLPERKEVFQVADAMTLNGLLRPDWRLAVLLMYGCGLRINEALGLKYSDVNHDHIRVQRQNVSYKGTAPLKHRSEGDSRVVPLPPWLAAEIPPGAPGDFLVSDRRVNIVRYAFMRAAKVAGLPDDFTPHDLRHACASLWLSNGMPVADAARYLGHADISTTFQTYSHAIPSHLEQAQRVLAAIWDD